MYFLPEKAKHEGQRIQESVRLRTSAQRPLEWRHYVAHITVLPAITDYSGEQFVQLM